MGGAGVANGYAIEGISVGRVECALLHRPETPRFTAAPLPAATKTSLIRACANEPRIATGALCIAWEGSGAARVAAFNQLRFVELRSITDGADADAVTSFRDSLPRAMPNISQRLIRC